MTTITQDRAMRLVRNEPLTRKSPRLARLRQEYLRTKRNLKAAGKCGKCSSAAPEFAPIRAAALKAIAEMGGEELLAVKRVLGSPKIALYVQGPDGKPQKIVK